MLLLDTCTLIWLVLKQENLSNQAKLHISNYAGGLYVSAISAFEITMHVNKNILSLPMSAIEWFRISLKLHGLTELQIDSNIAAHSVLLPPIHKDPVDRMIIATAKLNNLKILTPDNPMHNYPDVKCVW